MKNLKRLSTIPNLPLLSGVLIFFSVILLFSYIQYSSSLNLINMEKDLRKTVFDLYQAEDHHQLLQVYSDLQKMKASRRLSLLYRTIYGKGMETGADVIPTRESLRQNLAEIGELLETCNREQNRTVLILFFSLVAMSLILAIFLTISVVETGRNLEREEYQHRMDQMLIRSLEEERNLLALELHDDVAQKLALISQHLHQEERGHTDLLKRYNRDIIDKIRTMSHSLRSPEFNTVGLQKQIESLVADFRSLSSIQVNIEVNGLSVLHLDDQQKLHVYRIIQELLTNCRKHSRAGNVSIRILYVHPELRIFYRDDGIGMEKRDSRESMGLRGIDYRLNILNGRMIMKQEDGLKITFTIPVPL